MKKLIPLAICALISVAGLTAAAQEAVQPPQPPRSGGSQPTGAQVPLRVQLLVSRYSGDKKVSSIPYTFSVIANDNDKTSLRMSVKVPIPVNVFGGKDGAAPVTSYTYESIGTNIDCMARSVEGGLFKLDLGVSDTSVFLTEKQTLPPTGIAGVPAIRSFTSTFNILLRDGQTAQHTSATDPVSGEVLRIDVTVTVLK